MSRSALRRQFLVESIVHFLSQHLFPVAFVTGIFPAFVLTLCIDTTFAGNAQWDLNPSSGNRNTAANWTPMTVPNGSADTATFALSNNKNVSISVNTEVNGITFTVAATNPYTITASPSLTLTISGTGITNNSGTIQNFVTAAGGASNFGQITFNNNATAGNLTTFTNLGTVFGVGGGLTHFNNTSTAGNATINNNGAVVFRAPGGVTQFVDSSTAANATINNNGGRALSSEAFGSQEGGFTEFYSSSTAGNATITNNGGAVFGVSGGFTSFYNSSTAANATIINSGPTVISAGGGFTEFYNTSTAGNATITNNAAGGTQRGTRRLRRIQRQFDRR